MASLRREPSSKQFLMAFLGLLTPPGPLLVPVKPKWGPNRAEDVGVPGRAHVQEHHQRNRDPIAGLFCVVLWAGFGQALCTAIIVTLAILELTLIYVSSAVWLNPKLLGSVFLKIPDVSWCFFSAFTRCSLEAFSLNSPECRDRN